MGKMWDYVPAAVQAADKEPGITQTDLSERVWGTSGRGNTNLTKGMFPAMVTLGYLRAEKKGRTIRYFATALGKSKAVELEDRMAAELAAMQAKNLATSNRTG